MAQDQLYKDTECRNGDFYRGECISFGSEEEFQRFLSDYEGTVFAAPGPKSVIVWCYRDEQTAVSQEEWDALDAPVTERRIYNAPPTRETRQGSRAAHHGLLFRQTGIFL